MLQAKREAEEWAQLQHGHYATIYISRDGGIRVGEEYTYSLMPLLASGKTITFSILKHFLLETSESSNFSVLKSVSPLRFLKNVREMGVITYAIHI